MKGIADWLV